MARSSLTTPYFPEPRTPPLRSSRRRRKGGRTGNTVSSSSSLTLATMSSSLSTLPLSRPKLVEKNNRDRLAESSSAPLDHPSTGSPSSVFLLPSAGLKLGHMFSLIKQDDVEFKHHFDCTQIYFSSKKGGPRMMLPLKARRLRGLIALAHHLDEEDRLRGVPTNLESQSLQPSTPFLNMESNTSAVPSTA